MTKRVKLYVSPPIKLPGGTTMSGAVEGDIDEAAGVFTTLTRKGEVMHVNLNSRMAYVELAVPKAAAPAKKPAVGA